MGGGVHDSYLHILVRTGGIVLLPLARQIKKKFKLIFFYKIFLLHHIGNVNRIHMLFEF